MFQRRLDIGIEKPIAADLIVFWKSLNQRRDVVGFNPSLTRKI